MLEGNLEPLFEIQNFESSLINRQSARPFRRNENHDYVSCCRINYEYGGLFSD